MFTSAWSHQGTKPQQRMLRTGARSPSSWRRSWKLRGAGVTLKMFTNAFCIGGRGIGSDRARGA